MSAPARSPLRWLRALYLPGHHRRVRGRSDHPLQHARRLLDLVTRAGAGGGLLCDVGAGSEPGLLDRAWPGRRLTLDLAPAPGVDVVADGYALPLHDKSVEVVLLMQVLEHVTDPLRFLKESARVMRPGGFLCLTVPQYHIIHNHPGDYYRYTLQGLQHLCAAADLRVVRAWATGGPFLVVFHAIELNLPQKARIAFAGLTYALFDWLDGRLCGHGNGPRAHDAVGWAVLATRA
ncbi:MAG TPA: class I SAM-dependent methyltransferase [Methylomirabilota bacterium]|nr:class I SAM-dependent methyltransferase [Methylomirabilota bacterium]